MAFKMSRDILIHYTEDIQSLSLRKGCCNKWSENAGIAKISFAPHPPILAHLWIWNATCFMLFFGLYFFTCFVIFCQSHKQSWHSQNPLSWQWPYFHFIFLRQPLPNQFDILSSTIISETRSCRFCHQEDIWKTLGMFCAILLQQSANSRRTFQLIGNNIPFVYDIVPQELGMA